MFKNITIYRIVTDFFPELDAHEQALAAATFTPCLPSQDKSAGWAPPREENGAMVEPIDGQRITEFVIERKAVPGSAVAEKAQAAADRIEAETGRKPGKKEMKELREDALQSLLPQAFPRRAAVPVWVDLKAGLAVVGSTSQSHLDEIVTSLVRTFRSLSLAPLQTNVTPGAIMSSWLLDGDKLDDDDRHGFAIGRACTLKSADESKATVKFDHHHLINDEVHKHITEGKLPASLALEWEGRVAFTLTEGGRLKGIKFLEDAVADLADDADGFDTDVVIATGELRKLIPALIEALGGEVERKAEGAAGATP